MMLYVKYCYAELDSAGSAYAYLRLLDSGGSVISASEYDWAQMDLRYTSAGFAENRRYMQQHKGLLWFCRVWYSNC